MTALKAAAERTPTGRVQEQLQGSQHLGRAQQRLRHEVRQQPVRYDGGAEEQVRRDDRGQQQRRRVGVERDATSTAGGHVYVQQ